MKKLGIIEKSEIFEKIKMEKILSEHARKRKQLRIQTATILVNEFGKCFTIIRVLRTHWSTNSVIILPI